MRCIGAYTKIYKQAAHREPTPLNINPQVHYELNQQHRRATYHILTVAIPTGIFTCGPNYPPLQELNPLISGGETTKLQTVEDPGTINPFKRHLVHGNPTTGRPCNIPTGYLVYSWGSLFWGSPSPPLKVESFWYLVRAGKMVQESRNSGFDPGSDPSWESPYIHVCLFIYTYIPHTIFYIYIYMYSTYMHMHIDIPHRSP